MLVFERDRWPELDDWARGCDWAWLVELPDHLHDAARCVSYYVLVLALTGPVGGLSVRGVADPDGLVVAVLRARGYLRLVEGGSVVRWVRVGLP